mgnify:CR=1 FL=1
MTTSDIKPTVENQITVCSRFVDVKGSRMHYREIGQGDPILFLHGMPVSSFLWRNVLQASSSLGRCIAPDLIGMGQSDQPDISYRVFDHVDYITAFIEELGLQNITLVLHGWGSVPGFEYARLHTNNISRLVFFESHIRPTVDPSMLSLPVQQLSSMLLDHDASRKAVIEQNYMIRKVLPSCVVGDMCDSVLEEYAKPFQTEKSRQVLWQYLQDLPLGRSQTDVVDLMARYSDWLQHCDIPKLMLYAMPGFITTMDTVQWASEHLSHLTQICLEDVMHLPQESVPGLFSQAFVEWCEDNQVSGV